MRPQDDADWSDSDDDLGDDIETAVQLGLPDGPIQSADDLRDPSVSRIGGHPTFLSAPHPPPEIARCKSCAQPMHLLVQIWCPLEGSPNDRVLYIWACPASPCQRKVGSVRAWREVRHNPKYAAKLARQLAKEQQKQKERADAAAQAKARAKANPFALSGQPAAATGPFGLGAQIFGSGDDVPPHTATPHPAADNTADRDAEGAPPSDSDDDESESDDHNAADLAAALEAASLSDSAWPSAPAFAPLYLSTVSEYIPPRPKEKLPAGVTVLEEGGDADKRGGFAPEAYENSLDVDQAFERFSKRVGYEAEQCLRYELGGTPLPYASDAVLDALFPVPAGPPAPVTKAAFMVAPARKRAYAPAALPPCAHCGARRVYECQVMPNLINVLRTPQEGGDALDDEARLKEVMRALKGEGAEGRSGMEWGTCMVFSCEKDCAEEGAARTWREEHLLVQWDV